MNAEDERAENALDLVAAQVGIPRDRIALEQARASLRIARALEALVEIFDPKDLLVAGDAQEGWGLGGADVEAACTVCGRTFQFNPYGASEFMIPTHLAPGEDPVVGAAPCKGSQMIRPFNSYVSGEIDLADRPGAGENRQFPLEAIMGMIGGIVMGPMDDVYALGNWAMGEEDDTIPAYALTTMKPVISNALAVWYPAIARATQSVPQDAGTFIDEWVAQTRSALGGRHNYSIPKGLVSIVAQGKAKIS